MAEYLLHHLDVCAARDREAGCGMPQFVRMEARFPDLGGCLGQSQHAGMSVPSSRSADAEKYGSSSPALPGTLPRASDDK